MKFSVSASIKLAAYTIILATTSLLSALSTNEVSIRLLSYNVRVDHEQDSYSENKWIHRRDKVVSLIKKHGPAILTLQEPNEAQIIDLKHDLGDRYEWIVGRASDLAYEHPELYISEQHRETQAIAYDKTRFIPMSSGRFWLAEDPTKEPLKEAWDGSPFTRVAVFANLFDNVNQKALTILTAHFDHQGIEARINSAHLMVQKGEELSDGAPFIITGDFNTFQTGRAPEIYQAFKTHASICDIRESAPIQEGPVSTWIGWEYNNFNEKKLEILAPGMPPRWDHIFHSVQGIEALRTAVDDTQFQIEWDNAVKTVYPSDHRPMVADFLLK